MSIDMLGMVIISFPELTACVPMSDGQRQWKGGMACTGTAVNDTSGMKPAGAFQNRDKALLLPE